MPSPTYLSYVVRLWRERSLEQPTAVADVWEGEIEHIQTGERWHFTSIEELLAFLRYQVNGE
mgnify:CR=1 FL=1